MTIEVPIDEPWDFQWDVPKDRVGVMVDLGDGREAKWAALDPPVAFLPHSCDAWIIGRPDDVRQLIKELEAALELMEAKP